MRKEHKDRWFSLFFLICAALLVSSALGQEKPAHAQMRDAERSFALRLFEVIRNNNVVMEDGTIVPVKKLQFFAADDSAPQLDKTREQTAGGDWRWVIDEEGLARNGLRAIATTIAEALGDGMYAIQHLYMKAYAETTVPNFILSVPWDKSKVSGNWVEGLARPCGMLDYPIGDGITVKKEGFQMLRLKNLDRETFLEHLKEGGRYEALISKPEKCPSCKGLGRKIVDAWLGKDEQREVPCKNCNGTGSIRKNFAYEVAW